MTSPTRSHRPAGFSLVEVTLALGLVSFVLVALLGLFASGLNSNRASSVDTAVGQIVRDVVATYDASVMTDGRVSYENAYSYEGKRLASSNAPEKHFSVTVEGKPASEAGVPDSSSHCHLLTIEIIGVGQKNIIAQAFALVD